MRKRPAWILVLALAVAVLVATAAVAQPVSEHSLQPIWTVGWIPAALVAALARPQTAGLCRRRLHRRSRA